MSEHKISEDFFSQNVLFRIWKYGLFLPKFIYNNSKGVFEFKKSYIRFFNWMVLLLLNFIIVTGNKSASSDSLVIILITAIYSFFLLSNTWYTIFVIYFNVGTIEKMSVNMIKLFRLETTSGIYEYKKRKRIEFVWLIFVMSLYSIIFLVDICFVALVDDFNLTVKLVFHIFCILEIEFQQLLICFKSSILYHAQDVNSFSKNGNETTNFIKHYETIIDETKMAASDFMSVSSHMILVKCLYLGYSFVVCLFMQIQFIDMNMGVLKFSLICVNNIIWFSIETSMVLLVVRQDFSVYKEVS